MSKKPCVEFSPLELDLPENEKIVLINCRLKCLIKHFRGKADKSKRYYTIYRYGSILLASLTTIVSSLLIIHPTDIPQWVLPLCSAAATVAVAFLGASGVQKIWINSRTTQQRLETEHLLFNQQAGRYSVTSNQDRIKLFTKQLVEIWNEGHGIWKKNVGDDWLTNFGLKFK